MKSVKTKILLGFVIVIILTTILAGFNYYTISEINKETEDLVNHQMLLLIYDEQLAFNIAQRIALTRGYILYGDPDYRDRFDQYTLESRLIQEELLKKTGSEEAKKLIDKSIQWRKLVVDKVFKNYDNGNREEALRILSEEAKPLARDIMTGFESIALEREENIKESGQSVLENGREIINTSVIVSVIVIITGIVLAFIIAINITKPINQVSKRMKLIANGDISKEDLIIKSKDEVGELAKSTNEMQRNLKEVIKNVYIASEHVSSQSEELTQSANEVKEGSEQIASTMQELSSGAESQANSSTNLSEMMVEFVGKTQQANKNGEIISETSNEVLTMTEDGRQLMDSSIIQMQTIDTIVKNAVTKVKGLDEQSKKISKLVQVIQDIADQTNLLSLNAAIESARAGEHGRGFAVVAGEVRKLSEQVSTSVVDITNIVTNIQSESSNVVESLESGYQKVDEGSKQMEVTGKTFEMINKSISEMVAKIQSISANLKEISANSNVMDNLIGEIASVSEEAAAGTEQAAAAAQQSSSSVEEVAKSADDLAQLAEQLMRQISQFKM